MSWICLCRLEQLTTNITSDGLKFIIAILLHYTSYGIILYGSTSNENLNKTSVFQKQAINKGNNKFEMV